jgi:hypothetical protein
VEALAVLGLHSTQLQAVAMVEMAATVVEVEVEALV